MKTTRNRWIAACVGMLACALATLPAPSAAEEEDPIVVTVGEQVSIGELEFVLSPFVEQLVELWGAPDRVRNLANDVRIWDDLGVRAYSSPGSTQVDSLSFTMRKPDSDLAAKSVFAGRIVLPEGTLTSESTGADLAKLGFTPHEALSKFRERGFLTTRFLAEVDEDADDALVALSMEFGL